MRKIIAGTLLVLGSIFLGLSLAVIIMTWVYKAPLTQAGLARLQSVDLELTRVQSALQNAKLELDRTMRLVDSTEKSMAGLKDQLAQAKSLFGVVSGTLDQQLIPGLKGSREKITQAKNTLESLRTALEQLNALSLLGINLPGDVLLADLIGSASTLDTEIARVEDLVQKASTFAGDSAYLLGADFTETRKNLQNFLIVVNEYDAKIVDWRVQVAELQVALPGWIDVASISLTIFLVWVVFSQLGILLHGLNILHGGDPLDVLRSSETAEYQI